MSRPKARPFFYYTIGACSQLGALYACMCRLTCVCPVGRGLYPAMLHVHTVLSQCRFGPVGWPIG